MKLSFELKILAITLFISLMLIAVGMLSGDPGVLGNSIIISLFIVAGPQLFMRYEKYRAVRDMEEKFPSFVHDLIELIRSGMPFHHAIITSSRTDYGALSKEVKKMSNQLTWGVTFDRVLDYFIDRVKSSRKLYMSSRVIKESYLSGGDVVSTLESVANNNSMLQDIEKERKAMLNQYVVLMYAITVIFVLIIAAINKLMIPIFEVSTTPGAEEFLGMSNPCDTCVSLSCSICGMYGATASVFSIDPNKIGAYYISLFFFMSMIVSICSGLVAGQISENSVTAGIKHSMIMAMITFGAFSILVRIGFLGV